MLGDVFPRVAPAHVTNAPSAHREGPGEVSRPRAERMHCPYLADQVVGELSLRVARAYRLAALCLTVGHVVGNGSYEKVAGIYAVGIVAAMQDALAVQKLMSRCGDIGYARRQEWTLGGHIEVAPPARLRGAKPRPTFVVSALVNVTLEPRNLPRSERPQRIASLAHELLIIARTHRHSPRVVIPFQTTVRRQNQAPQQTLSALPRRSPSQAQMDRLEGR
jgi:hypothetical protein